MALGKVQLIWRNYWRNNFFSNKQIQRVIFSRIVRVSEMAMIVNLPRGKKNKDSSSLME